MADLHDLTNKVKDTADDVKHDVQDTAQHVRDSAMEEKGRLEQGMDDAKAELHDEQVKTSRN